MTLTKAARLALLLAIPGLVLSGCGRKGDLDRPGLHDLDQHESARRDRRTEGDGRGPPLPA
ncbi:putative small lipoprotein YifL [Sinorhizobium fredii]